MNRLIATVVFAFIAPFAQAEVLRMAVTTSFNNSGLSDVLLPQIKADTGLDVQLLVVGTGQAIKLGQAGDVDAILVHARAAEGAFVAQGYGTHRREIMFNDFVLIGPSSDPAGIAKTQSAAGALARIAAAQADFVSRGDDSGTHKKERDLWGDAGLDPDRFGAWYKEVGAGMGAALNTAAGLDAYIMADRASWLNFANRRGLALLFAGDAVLFNQYAYLPVSDLRHAHVNHQGAMRLERWLTSPTAAALINGYQINGAQLFTFNAK
ncbi:substrate-binding domain-containing protein [Sulfitobacter aestuariivivens]|uniref:Substrate-binding domain-containing protein n=1 Tax=Sulfitobacter aestuariivivens TaxID=2766981 RepID=A0A927HFC9_9RHOB|nr:substrate-binding domain-containing protein [Sulfitobacter aestuariivivens]MBD3665707.1 substrate-binding domain-containing protein [Sulfitobacter aestuariivivens]